MKNKKVLLIVGIVLTLLLLCIVAIVALTGAGLTVLNPAQKISESNDKTRKSDLAQISQGFRIYLSEEPSIEVLNEIEACEDGETVIGTDGFNMSELLVPEYMVSIPTDPQGDSADTGYRVCGEETGDVKFTAPNLETEEGFSVGFNVLDILSEGASEVDTSEGFIDARNAQRSSDATQILNAVTQYITSGNDLDLSTCNIEKMAIGTSEYDLGAVLVPDYLAAMPQDPSVGTQANTGYTICENNKGQISVEAPNAEGGVKIQVLR